jgi:hypothetical protein
MLNDDDGLAGIAAKYTPDKVGRELSKLSSQNYSLSQQRVGAKRIWTIDIQQLTQGGTDEPAPF